MTKPLAEVLLFVSLAINATLLIFIAGALRKVLNDLERAGIQDFCRFAGSSFNRKSPFMLTALNIPAIGAIPYLYFYGLSNRWLVAGLVLWFVGGCIAKIIKVSIYKAIAALDPGDASKLRAERRKLNAGNILQAVLDSIAVVLATIPFVGR